MRLKTALKRRIFNLCAERDITMNELARRCGMSHSTLGNILNGRNNSTTLRSIQRLCQGLNMSIPEFFDSILFRDLEQDIF